MIERALLTEAEPSRHSRQGGDGVTPTSCNLLYLLCLLQPPAGFCCPQIRRATLYEPENNIVTQRIPGYFSIGGVKQ